MVVLATSETATSGVLAVLSNTTVTGRDVSTVLASLGEPRRHFLQRPRANQRLVSSSVIRPPQGQSTAEFFRSSREMAPIRQHESSRIQRE